MKERDKIEMLLQGERDQQRQMKEEIEKIIKNSFEERLKEKEERLKERENATEELKRMFEERIKGDKFSEKLIIKTTNNYQRWAIKFIFFFFY